MKNQNIQVFLLIFILYISSISLFAQKTWKDKLSFNLITELDFSYNFIKGKLQKTEFILKPEWQYRFNKNLKLVGIGRLYFEATDNLEIARPNQSSFVSPLSRRLLIGDRAEAELRELYLHARIKKKLHLRIGKQQIVWGETDGLKLLDVVNPQYFREFVLDKFEDSRIPLWSVKAEFSIKEWKAQLIWIPDPTVQVLPGFNDLFFLGNSIPIAPANIPVQLNPFQPPTNWISDSDIGIKLSTFYKGWDLTFNYLYHHEDLPVLNRQFLVQPDGEVHLNISPLYKRNHLAGMTFNKPLSTFTLRGELAYAFNRHFTIAETSDQQGSVASDNLLFAVGVDYIRGDWILSPQLFSDILISTIPAFNRNRYEANFSFLVSKEFLNTTIKAEILWIQTLNRGDGLLRPKVKYLLSSNVESFMSSDIFYGNNRGLFGQFGEQSRISLGLRWGI